ncbi:hypothetical protein Y032_0618g717 [Ancylostoma ceylanicum]|uniref:Uncharacterized protein n=2 Tax=Ancylostoma ceylanicum TaxID=53326 RepID=A0A016WMU3_9BILA|nr:hypothetical protein Y032_0618g717 [Ancylostoma ceylanicum]EYC40363.1 hypothetical protein Y032_0618g717 [Ancylostoma ceylanicum]
MQLLLPLLTLLLITPHVPSTTNNGTHLTPADLHNIQPTRKGVAKQNGTYHRSRIKRFKIIDWMFKKSSTTAQPPLRDPPTPPWAPPQGPPARTWEPPWAQPTPPWQSSHGPPTRPWEPPWTQPTPPREPPWGPPTPPWTQPSDPPHITTETTTPTTTTTTRPPATAETVKVTTTMAKTKTRASSSTKRKRTSSLVVGDLSPLPSTQGVSAQPDSTEGTEEFHDPEFIGVHVLQYTKRFRDGKRKREEESSTG